MTGYATAPHPSSPERLYSGGIFGYLPDHLLGGKWSVAIREQFVESGLPLAAAVKIGHWEVIGKKDIGGYVAWGLRSSDAIIRHPRESVEIWVAPLQDFAPVAETETFHFPDGQDLISSYDDVKLALLDGRWIPRHSHLTTINDSRHMDAAQVAEIEVTEYSATLRPDTEFVVKFPVGTHVYDRIRKIGFVAGKFVEVKGSDGLMRRAAINLFPEYDALTDHGEGLTDAQYAKTHWARGVPLKVLNKADFASPKPISSVPLHRWGVPLAVLVVCALVCCGVVYERRKKRHA